ncbi:MAG: PIN domain-containing protein [Vulcanimicrobiaceae bacterium]
MSDKTFVDTNVLIYAHDIDAGSKRTVAQQALGELWESGTGVISPQVLQEFYVNVTKKIAIPLSRESARLIVDSYAIWCIDVSSAEISMAFRIEDEASVGFWDALIIASAAKANAVRLLSEDLNSGQTIAGVRIENPFAAIR